MRDDLSGTSPIAIGHPQRPLTVCIGVPSGDQLYADFAMSLAAIAASVARGGGISLAISNPKSAIIANSRNLCVEAALGLKADWLLFLDSDMVVPADVVHRLLRHGKPIVGATYTRRRPPYTVLGSRWDSLRDMPAGGLVRMGEMPTGCLMIRTDLFAKLPKPWFRFEVNGDGLVGEDILFCRTMTGLGVEIWCDMDLSRELKHIGTHGFCIDEMQAVQAEQAA